MCYNTLVHLFPQILTFNTPHLDFESDSFKGIKGKEGLILMDGGRLMRVMRERWGSRMTALG